MATFRQGEGKTYQVHALGPTTREDGSDLNISEIQHYIRFLSFNDGAPIEQTVELVEDASTPEYDGKFDEVVDIDSHEPGIYTFAYKTVDTGGRQSRLSESATLEILPPLANPNPPTDLSPV